MVVETREIILRKALEYFSHTDYEKTSLNDIAEALGVTRGAIYHYFDNKESLFKEAIMSVQRQVRAADEIRKQKDLDFKSFLRHALSLEVVELYEHKEILGQDPDVFKNLSYLMMVGIKKFPEVESLYRENFSLFYEEILNRVRKAQEEGVIFEDIDPEALAFEIVSISTGSSIFCGIQGALNPFRMGEKTFQEIWSRIKI